MMNNSSEQFYPEPTNGTNDIEEYHTSLLVIYSVVLLCGTVSLSLMMHIMKSSTVSTTSIAVLNLIFAHFIFLFTVPFRIYYYSTNRWTLGPEWCKMVSAMIHIHMYMSFILYVIILVTRLLTFYHKTTQVASFRRMPALMGSALVWIIVLVVVPCIIYFLYGKQTKPTEKCFNFGEHTQSPLSIVFNYIMSSVIIVVALGVTALQVNVLRILYRTNRQGQQEFGAQLKSLFFALIMVACFIPYHIFRLYYLKNFKELQSINEVFLSLTTFNCLDMLTFLGRRTCSICLSGRAN
ncbi:putative G-protein coupled receptor 141 [Odontesthes bonariensis]|uniref:putative G-protein coupled receptor 141 n=1 Tax=Odontesthes bonariensis TaxID=219752 RepID=UPI003F58F87B